MSTPEKGITGSCLCGAVRYRAEFPSKWVTHCHCDNCRRAQGAGLVTYAGFWGSQVSFTCGEDLLTSHLSDCGSTRRFCSLCGSTMLYSSPRWPGEVHLLVANVDGTLDRQPDGHAYADRAPAWCPISDDLPRYGGETGLEPL